jgi:hypothetical protein
MDATLDAVSRILRTPYTSLHRTPIHPKACRITPEMIAQFRAIGPGVLPALVQLSREGDWDAMYALAEVGGEAAIETLYSLLLGGEVSDIGSDTFDVDIFDVLHRILPRFGQAAVEPGLAAYARAPDVWARRWLATILSLLRIHDERIEAILLSHLESEPDWGAHMIQNYGEPRHLPLLVNRFDRYALPEPLREETYWAVDGLADAIVSLGGTLSHSQREKVARCREDEQASRGATPLH